MKPENNIEETVKQFHVAASPEMDQRILSEIIPKQKKIQTISSVESQTNIWRIAIKSKIPQYAIIAIICLMGFVVIFKPGNESQNILLADVITSIQKEPCMHILWRLEENNLTDPNFVKRMQKIESWISVNPHRTVSVLNDGLILFIDEFGLKKQIYNPKTNIIETTHDISDTQNQPLNFTNMIFYIINEEVSKGAKVEYIDSFKQGETVTIININPSNNSEQNSTISLMVDPHTLLPKKITTHQWIASEQWATMIATVDFSTKTGPTDIYEAGAPHDARIIIIQ